MLSPEDRQILSAALRVLAECCDGARTKDRAGFSAIHVDVGHWLAQKDPAAWGENDVGMAAALVRHYRKTQLDPEGKDAKLSDVLERAKRDCTTRPKKIKVDGRVEIVDGNSDVHDDVTKRIRVYSNYKRELIEEQKDLIDNIYIDGTDKGRDAAGCLENAMAVQAMARKWGLRLPDNWTEVTADWPAVRHVSVVSGVIEIRGVSRDDFGDGQSGDNRFDWRRGWIGRLPGSSWNLAWASERIAEIDPDLPGLASLALEVRRAEQEEARLRTMSAALEGDASLIQGLPQPTARAIKPFQIGGISYILNNPCCIVADEQGLGKSLQALIAVELANAYPAVVVAPAVARIAWRREIERWLPHRRAHVIGVGKGAQGVPLTKAGVDVLILNYELLGANAEVMASLNPKTFVLDEAQYLKTHDSKRTEKIKEVLKATNPQSVLLLTGTPIMNRPSELLTMLTVLPRGGALERLGGFWHFARRYCDLKETFIGWGRTVLDFSGSSNLDELHDRLRATCLLRREKKQALPELADKVYLTVEAEISNRAEYEVAKTEFARWLEDNRQREEKQNKQPHRPDYRSDDIEDEWSDLVADLLSDLGCSQRSEALQKITYLRQLSGVGKIAEAANWIARFLAEGPSSKLVVFAYHLEVQTALAAQFPGSLTIAGNDSPLARDRAIQKFQHDASNRLIICSLKATQTALTLTAASTALFIDLDWTPSSLDQAADRIHRIGQMDVARIVTLIAPQTMDDRMMAVLEKKRGIISQAITNQKGNENNPIAPFGYLKNGMPRLQAPGPGRPRKYSDDERRERNNKVKAAWKNVHRDKQAAYTRAWRQRAAPEASASQERE